MTKGITLELYYNSLLKIKVPLHSKCDFLLVLSDKCLCRMMYVQSLTVEGCFHIHLLTVDRKAEMSRSIENPILKRGLMSRICGIANSLEVNSSPIFNFNKCDVEKGHIHRKWTLQ